MERQTVTREEVIELVKRLPSEKLAEVYDFVVFLQTRPTITIVEGEENVAAEDALWDAIAAQYADKRAQLEARIANAPALPMFDEDGRWLVDDYEEQAVPQAGRSGRM